VENGREGVSEMTIGEMKQKLRDKFCDGCNMPYHCSMFEHAECCFLKCASLTDIVSKYLELTDAESAS